MRSPAAAGGDRQARCSQSVEQSPAVGVDGGGIGQRLFQLLADAFQPSRILGEERLDGLAALVLVAANAGQSEIGYTVRATSCFWMDVIDVDGRDRY